MVIKKMGNNFLLTYDDGDYIVETDDFVTCLNRAKQLRGIGGEDKIRIRCMNVYTSNYRKGSGDAVAISIAGKCPEEYKGLEYKKLAPKLAFWKEWEKTRDDEYYIQHFNDEVLSHLDPEDVLLELAELSNGKDVCLLCYEEEGEFCHRFLVAKWLNENIFDYGWQLVSEILYDEIEAIVKEFKERNYYDAIDEDTFASESFHCEMENNLMEREMFNSDEEYISYTMKTVMRALNFCQYGDSSDPDDEAEKRRDLERRDFFERIF